ncbi:hypothetical protein ACFX2I_000974 [Malus domestica]
MSSYPPPAAIILLHLSNPACSYFQTAFAAVFREAALRSSVLTGSGAPHHHPFNVSHRRRFRDSEFWVCFLMGGDPESPPIRSSPSRF